MAAKDKDASDSMDPAMDLMGLNGLIRKAINLVRGVEISITDDTFKMAITSVIPWFKVPNPTALFFDAHWVSAIDIIRLIMWKGRLLM